MIFEKLLVSLLFLSCVLLANAEDSSGFIPAQKKNFVENVAPDFKLSAVDVQNALSKAVFQQSIIDKMTKPAESKSFGDYRKLLITPRRVAAGKDFIRNYPFAFNRAKRVYGVPKDIISAIVGVETFYGKNTGKYRVLDALTTLALGYPKRAEYFQQELARYILLVKKNNWSIENLMGSYAGAFGWAQFMPSSYLAYAISAYPGAQANLYNPNDVVMSIGNYFKKSGWIPGGPVAVRVKISSQTCEQLTCNKRKPLYSVATWRQNGVSSIPKFIPNTMKAGVVILRMDDGPEAWMIFQNFYVITCYNISINYAMAVYELSQAIKKAPT